MHGVQFHPQRILMSEKWSKAFVVLNSNPSKTAKQLVNFYRHFHFFLPRNLLRHYLTH